MRAFLLVLAFPLAAHAEQPLGTAQAPWGHASIFASPCKHEAVLKQLPADMRSQFKRAHVQHEGKPYKACWMEISPGVVFLIDEAGDQGAVPAAAFVKPTKS